MTSADTPSVDERLHDLDQRLVARIAEITRDELAGRRREQARISPETTELADRLLEYRRDSVRLIFSRIVLDRQGDGGLRILDLDMDYYLIR